MQRRIKYAAHCTLVVYGAEESYKEIYTPFRSITISSSRWWR